MNFFAQQDRARRNTFWLVALLCAAVFCLIVLTVLVVSVAMYFAQNSTTSISAAQTVSTPIIEQIKTILNSELIFWVSGGVLALVIGGSLYKLMALGNSGQKVALALGGRLIPPNTSNRDEKKIINVVEEMALASGNPVPQVYVLEETGINAFAAGVDRRNAVIGITRGCIELLNREELQGVIAHEFSHIHFGDMRLNIRLVAILHGILLIGLIGSYVLRSSAYSHGYNHRRKNGGAQLGVGLALFSMGYIGVFFGNLIKAAVSRQREFLADASAVQFTRNPQGIANALKKIGGAQEHALLQNPKAAQFSHFYFGQGVRSALGSIMATHPPLADRIKRIEPQWQGDYIQATPKVGTSAQTEQSGDDDRRRNQAFVMAAGAAAAATAQEHASAHGNAGAQRESAQQAVDSIGQIPPNSLAHAQNFIAKLEPKLHQAAHEPFSARALVYCLLLDRDNKRIRSSQTQVLKAQAHPVTFKAVIELESLVDQLDRDDYLPLLELCIPALKMQSKPQYQVFKKNLVALIKADGEISLMEWCFYRSVRFCCEEIRKSGNRPLHTLSSDISILLAAICYSGKTIDTQAAYTAADKHLPHVKLAMQRGADVSFQRLDSALNNLSELKELDKPKLLKAVAECIYVDKQVTAEEAEMFRAIADSLNCPVPLSEFKSLTR